MNNLLPDSITLRGGGGESPLLSIVVPVYNVEKYLRICLDSLINQTLKDIEIIVVNDCSPDNSEAIVLEYAARDERIVYLKHEENKCLGGARNTGIRAARGKYIAFVDSDDYVDTHLYKNAVNFFESHDVDVVFFSHVCFYQDQESTYITKGRSKIIKMNADKYALDFFYVVAWDKVYRLSDLRENDIFFPEHIYFEDSPFWTAFCCAVQPKAAFLGGSCGYYYYRRHKESITGKASQDGFIMPGIFQAVYENLRKNGYHHELFPVFHLWVGGVSNIVWRNLDDAHRRLFTQKFILFIRALDLCEEEYTMVPEWGFLPELSDLEQQVKLVNIYLHSNAMAGNFWYKFGQMSMKERIHKILKQIRKPRKTFHLKKRYAKMKI